MWSSSEKNSEIKSHLWLIATLTTRSQHRVPHPWVISRATSAPPWTACSIAWQLFPWINSSWCPSSPSTGTTWDNFTLVLSLAAWEERVTLTWIHSLFGELQRVIRPYLGLLFSCIKIPHSFRHSSQDLLSRPFTDSCSSLDLSSQKTLRL